MRPFICLGMIKISYKPYLLKNKYVFRIAGNARTSTPLMLVRVAYEDEFGYGEASMPSRYGESVGSATAFMQKVNLCQFCDPFSLEEILRYIDGIAPGNTAIKAAIDIALHDLIGKLLAIPVRAYFGLPKKDLETSKTIGIDTAEIVAERVREANGFNILKIKLGEDNDEEIIGAVRENTPKPLYIDANQGWKSKEQALEKIYWLKEQNVVFVEQPLPKHNFDDQEWLAAHSPLPIVGDEGIQRYGDLKSASSYYHAINIKLMKCTGLREAYKMAVTAKMMGLRVMFGCMCETSCAIGALAQLGYLADWVDLDGNLGVVNDPFVAHRVKQGVIILNDQPGIGLISPDWEKVGHEGGTDL